MQLSVTGDGYIKCVAGSEEHILAEQITVINASNLSLPCMKDRYDEKVLFYHIGDHISVLEYIKTKVMDFDAVKELAINLANIYIRSENAGLSNQKIVSDIRYVFISPSTMQLKVIQCPLAEYTEKNNYRKSLGSICNECKSKNAYIAIGYILEEIRQSGFVLKDFVKRLEKLENSRSSRNETAEVNRPVETRVVEKKVIVNKTNYLVCSLVAALLEIVGIVVVPLVVDMLGFKGSIYVNLISCVCVVLLTVLVFVILQLCTKKEVVQMSAVNNAEATMGNARIERTEGRELEDKVVFNKKAAQESVRLAKSMENFDDTGLLQEEVEINPLKRQEQYHKNAVPTVYLVDEETSKTHQVLKNGFVIGRASECDLVVNSSIVSKRHAEIIFEDGIFYVRDLNSSNYTYLNKANIEPMELYKIEDGSRIGFGNKWFIFKTSL